MGAIFRRIRLISLGPWLAFGLGLGVGLAGCGSSGSTATGAADAGTAPVAKIATPTGDPLAWAVDAVGPFNVGHRVFDVTYTPPGGLPSRTIPVDLFYPTLDADGEHPLYKKLFADKDVLENAAVAAPIDPKGYPVHVYSHGSSGFGGTSSDMAHWFVSHGWVYVAPNHVGNTLGDPEGKRPLTMSVLRSTDVSAAIDAVEKLAAPDPLAGKLRTKRVLLSGHSFGAFTVWISAGATVDGSVLLARCNAGDFTACRPEDIATLAKGLGDARVVAAIPMAGGPYEFITDYDAPKKPVLLMSGSEDVSGGPIFDQVKTLDLTWIELTGGCHQVFALGGCPNFDEKLGWKLTNTWALAWGRRFVLGDGGDAVTKIATGATLLSDKIKLKKKGTLSPPGGP